MSHALARIPVKRVKERGALLTAQEEERGAALLDVGVAQGTYRGNGGAPLARAVVRVYGCELNVFPVTFSLFNVTRGTEQRASVSCVTGPMVTVVMDDVFDVSDWQAGDGWGVQLFSSERMYPSFGVSMSVALEPLAQLDNVQAPALAH